MTPPDKTTVTQADREAKKRVQQRMLTEGVGESQVLDEELARHRIAATSDNLALMREAVEHLSSVLEIADEAFRKYETEFDADDTARLRAARDFEQATLAKLRDEIARGEG